MGWRWRPSISPTVLTSHNFRPPVWSLARSSAPPRFSAFPCCDLLLVTGNDSFAQKKGEAKASPRHSSFAAQMRFAMHRPLLFALALSLGGAALAAPPVTMTAQEDHAAMMRQLGVRNLHPAPSGDAKAPNQA